MDRLTYILDVSPASRKKSMPVGLAAVAVEDPRCAVVAQVSIWRLGGRASRWSTVALASVSVMCSSRGNRSDP